MAGNFLQQELAILTGAVDVMVVDVQCVIPVACRNCRVLPHQGRVDQFAKAHVPGAVHIEFHDERGDGDGQGNRARRRSTITPRRDPAKVQIPQPQQGPGGRVHHGSVLQILGGRYRPSFRPLNDGIRTGRLRGVAGVVGCNNPQAAPRRVPPGHGPRTARATTCWWCRPAAAPSPAARPAC